MVVDLINIIQLKRLLIILTFSSLFLICKPVYGAENKYCMAITTATVYNSPNYNDVSFDCISPYEAFYVDKDCGEFYHVISSYDYYVAKSDVLTGDALINWLDESNFFKEEVQVVVDSAKLRKKGFRGIFEEVPKYSLFEVLDVDKYNYLVMYEETECYIAKDDVHLVYRIPEHKFNGSYEELCTSLKELQDAIDKMINDIKYKDAVSNQRSEIIKEALKYVGNPYVWGGTNPNTGADCSGFVGYVYKQFGYNLPRTSYTQCNVGYEINSASDLKPGDLVFYYRNSKGRVGHVAMYIGNGKQVEAKGVKYGICVTDFNWDKVYVARNILGD